MKVTLVVGTIAIALAGCGSKGPTAHDACASLTKAGFGSGCRDEKPGGLGAAAKEEQLFDLEEPKGKTCGVYSFATPDAFDATVKAFEGAATLAGPHRYGNRKALVFVQCNSGMPAAKGADLSKAVEKL